MKAFRKTLGIILLLALSVLCLYSCKIGGDKPDGGGNTDGEGDDGSYIYKSDTLVNIIVNDTECSGEAPNVVLNALYRVLDSTPAFGGDELPDTGHEIIVGPSDREISKVAYRRLHRLDKLDEDTYFTHRP